MLFAFTTLSLLTDWKSNFAHPTAPAFATPLGGLHEQLAAANQRQHPTVQVKRLLAKHLEPRQVPAQTGLVGHMLNKSLLRRHQALVARQPQPPARERQAPPPSCTVRPDPGRRHAPQGPRSGHQSL